VISTAHPLRRFGRAVRAAARVGSYQQFAPAGPSSLTALSLRRVREGLFKLEPGGINLLDRMQFDTLGTIIELLQRVGRAWGQRDGNLNTLWEAILGALKPQ
jgi:hypothetical protein